MVDQNIRSMQNTQDKMYQKRFARHLIVITIVVVIVVFVLGILLGRGLANSRTSQIQHFIMNSELNTESFLIGEELIDNFDERDCELANKRINFLTEQLGETGRMLVDADSEGRMDPEDFALLKRKHHLMQTKTYLLMYDFMKYCNINQDIILFYYGTNDTYSPEQGLVLDRVVKDYGATVFAMEFNYSKDMDFMEDYYEIRATPSLVINYETKKEGLTDYNEVAGYLRAEKKA